MARPLAGEIVVVDWRGGRDGLEPGGLRPAVVVEAPGILAEDYPQLLVVPLTRHSRFAQMDALVQRIEPSQESAAPEVCWAVCHHVTSVALRRVRHTAARVSDAEMAGIGTRLRAALSLVA